MELFHTEILDSAKMSSTQLNGGHFMSLSIESVLAAKGIHPKPEHLKKLESKWEEIEGLKGNLANINLDDADISLRNIPGGDHVA